MHPDLLREIERDLATFIGPMASIALKRAIRQTDDVLGRLLDPSDRAAARGHGILEQGALADARLAGDHDDRTLPGQSRIECGLDTSALRCSPQKHRPILQLPGFRRFPPPFRRLW